MSANVSRRTCHGDGNPGARRLHERLGYEPSGQRFRAEYDYTAEGGTAIHAR